MKRSNYSILYVVHALPEEIYDLGRVINAIEQSTLENQNVDVTIYVDLNFSSQYYDWEHSKVGKEYFYNLFINYVTH